MNDADDEFDQLAAGADADDKLAYDIFKLGHQRGYAPKELVRHFGRIVSLMVKLDGENGIPPSAAVPAYLNLFMEGLGGTMVKVGSEEEFIAVLEADAARERGDMQ